MNRLTNTNNTNQSPVHLIVETTIDLFVNK